VQALIGIFKTMRPKQWTKNVLFVFPAILFDGQITNPDSLIRVVIACLLLILMSGTVYIINDIVDVEKDRQHPKKQFRPIPSNQLPINIAIIVAIIIPTLAIGFALFWDVSLAIVMILYLVLQIAYSFYLKHIPIMDVMAVTAGFVLRVLAGVVVIDVANFSPWLYACTGLLALFLIVGKRRQELLTLGEQSLKTRPIFEHYNLPLLDDMLRLVMTSTFITYLLYTIEVNLTPIANVNPALLTVPPVLFGLFRYMYLIHVKGEGSAPDEVLLTDRPLQFTIVVWGLTIFTILYILPRVIQPV
jgi:4-hydroxybenzoate polyprenyltransferase